MVDYRQTHCQVCGTPLTGRQEKSCSARCRAALSRRKRAEAQEERDRRLQRLVEVLAREVGLKPEDCP